MEAIKTKAYRYYIREKSTASDTSSPPAGPRQPHSGPPSGPPGSPAAAPQSALYLVRSAEPVAPDHH